MKLCTNSRYLRNPRREYRVPRDHVRRSERSRKYVDQSTLINARIRCDSRNPVPCENATRMLPARRIRESNRTFLRKYNSDSCRISDDQFATRPVSASSVSRKLLSNSSSKDLRITTARDFSSSLSSSN